MSRDVLTRATLALLCLALAAGCHKKPEAEPGPPEDEVWIARAAFERGEARVVPARTQRLAQSIVAGGRIAFDDLRVTHVFSPVSGRVTRVLAQLGQRVKKGTPLAAIVSPDVGSAYSDAVKARADLTAAEHDLKRQTALFAARAGSSRDLETSQDNYGKSKAEKQRADERLRLLGSGNVDAVTQEYLLPSHLDGRVIARNVSPGMNVAGQFSGGAPPELFTVGSIDPVWLYADVAESDLPALAIGATVTAHVLAYPGKAFQGMVEWVSPSLDPALRTARIRCALPNPDGLLKPEMFASVSIARPSVEQLAVPREAVVRISEQAFVYVEAGARPDGKSIFKRRHVQTSNREGTQARKAQPRTETSLAMVDPPPEVVPVLSGLAEGERVLVDSAQPHAAELEDSFLTEAQLANGKVQIATAEERDVPDAVTVGGRLTFDDLRVTHVFPPVGGRVTQVLAAPGQHVKKGAPLAVIASPDLGSALADEEKAKADLIAAEHEVKRQREMVALHASAPRDLELAEDNFRKADAELARARQKSRMLAGAVGGRSQELVLRAPIDGQVIARNANPGVEVQGQFAGGGNVPELFTIGSIDDLWLLGDLYESDLPYVKPGADVEVQVSPYPGVRFHGKVDWISDTLDPVQRTAKIRCVLKNEKGLLRPEMYEVVSITAPARHRLTVPRDAVLRLGDETDVFVEGPRTPDGRVPFKRRRVTANEQLPGDAVPILEGLKPGERVAAQGSIFLVGN